MNTGWLWILYTVRIHFEQDNPPAWTQEAYRPPHSKCSLCWFIWGVGTQGTPPDLRWGTPPDLRWGTPSDLRWGTPQTWDGVPPRTWDGVPPRPEMGYPPYLDLGWGTPLPGPGMGHPPYLDLGWGTPPTQTWDGVSPPEMLRDRHLWKQYLPVILRMRVVIILIIIRRFVSRTVIVKSNEH